MNRKNKYAIDFDEVAFDFRQCSYEDIMQIVCVRDGKVREVNLVKDIEFRRRFNALTRDMFEINYEDVSKQIQGTQDHRFVLFRKGNSSGTLQMVNNKINIKNNEQ